MRECSYCGSAIIFGGKKDGELIFCSQRCLEKGIVPRLATRLPDDLVMERATAVHQGNCPRCLGQGPVDVHNSFRIWSLVHHFSWSSSPQISCRSCGVRSKLGDALFCMAFGWWSPWGVILTPIALIRNIRGLFSFPDPSHPSDALKSMVRVGLASETIEEAEATEPVLRSIKLGRDYELSPIRRFGLALGAFLFILSAPISGYFLLKIFVDARASESWPTVMGKLTKAQVIPAGVGRFRAVVAYSYRVGAIDFNGSKIHASDGEFEFRDGAAQEIRGLIVGQPVTVFYNPSDPRQSLLRAGAGFQEYALLFVPIVMLGVGVVLFWRWQRSRRVD
jgi:hypothetical protein